MNKEMALPCFGGPLHGRTVCSNHDFFEATDLPPPPRFIGFEADIPVKPEDCVFKTYKYVRKGIQRIIGDSSSAVYFWYYQTEPEPTREEILHFLRGW